MAAPTVASLSSHRQIRQLTGRYKHGAGGIDELSHAINLENAASRLNVDLTTAQGKAWKEAFEKSQELRGGLARLEEQQRRSQATALEFGMAISSGLEQAIPSGQGLRDGSRGVLSDIANIALRQAFTEPTGPAPRRGP